MANPAEAVIGLPGFGVPLVSGGDLCSLGILPRTGVALRPIWYDETSGVTRPTMSPTRLPPAGHAQGVGRTVRAF